MEYKKESLLESAVEVLSEDKALGMRDKIFNLINDKYAELERTGEFEKEYYTDNRKYEKTRKRNAAADAVLARVREVPEIKKLLGKKYRIDGVGDDLVLSGGKRAPAWPDLFGAKTERRSAAVGEIARWLKTEIEQLDREAGGKPVAESVLEEGKKVSVEIPADKIAEYLTRAGKLGVKFKAGKSGDFEVDGPKEKVIAAVAKISGMDYDDAEEMFFS